MIISSKRLYNYFFYILILTVSVSIYSVDGQNSEFSVLFTNFLIIVASLFFMVNGDPYNYSLNKIFMLFSFFFFGIAPALQYQHGIVLWQGRFFTSDTYYFLNSIIIYILLFYQGLFYLFNRLKLGKFEIVFINKFNKERKILVSVLLGLSLLSFVITIFVHNFSMSNVLMRSGEKIFLLQSFSLVYSYFIRPIPVISLIFYKQYKVKNIWIEIILLIIALLTNFPTAAPRFYIAALYLPLLIVYLKQINYKYMLLNKLILVSFLFIFPVLDQARRITSFRDIDVSLNFNMFIEGHFDSYQMFMRVIDENVITRGTQLITSLLFFIPRSIWPDKSIGSGMLIAEKYGLSFYNVSMNYFGEGYINFGYPGILFFTIVIAFINARFDKIFWHKAEKYNWLAISYLFLLGLQIFVLRGDLLSGLAFTTGIIASVFFIYITTTKKTNKIFNTK